MDKKLRVLFISTGNSTRSQMGEGFLRVIGGERFLANSAGIQPGSLNPIAVDVMNEVGIDIAHQKSKEVGESIKESFSFVITVSDSAKERAPIFPSTPNLMHWSLKDPASITGSKEEITEAFRRTRDDIKIKVEEFVAQTAEKLKAAR